MDRRTFLCGLTLGTLAGPLAAEAQQSEKVYRIGLLDYNVPGAGQNYWNAARTYDSTVTNDKLAPHRAHPPVAAPHRLKAAVIGAAHVGLGSVRRSPYQRHGALLTPEGDRAHRNQRLTVRRTLASRQVGYSVPRPMCAATARS